MDVIIVCHTEFGTVKDRQVVFTKDSEGVIVGVAVLQGVAEKYGAKVTYAVSPEVATYFPMATGQEIGLHLHPGKQTFMTRSVYYVVGDSYLNELELPAHSTALRDYTLQEQLELIGAGAERISKVLSPPKVFVAGRWSMNNDTLRALETLEFSHDCSAFPGANRPHCDWHRLPRMCMPYHPSTDEYQLPGDSCLLEVPASQMIKGGCVNPENARIYGSIWLLACFEEYYRTRQPLFHICLHSPCMLDLYTVKVLDRLLKFISRHKNVHFRFASEIGVYKEGK